MIVVSRRATYPGRLATLIDGRSIKNKSSGWLMIKPPIATPAITSGSVPADGTTRGYAISRPASSRSWALIVSTNDRFSACQAVAANAIAADRQADPLVRGEGEHHEGQRGEQVDCQRSGLGQELVLYSAHIDLLPCSNDGA